MSSDITQIKRTALAIEILDNMRRYRKENNYQQYSNSIKIYEQMKTRITDKSMLSILSDLEKKIIGREK